MEEKKEDKYKKGFAHGSLVTGALTALVKYASLVKWKAVLTFLKSMVSW